MRLSKALVVTCAALVIHGPLPAQSSKTIEQLEAEKKRLEAEKDLITAQKDQIAAQAELGRTKVSALGLPSFENKTTLGEGAGKTETMILAAQTLGGAAELIRDELSSGPLSSSTFIILAGEEVFDFARYETLRAEMDAIRLLFDDALDRRPSLIGPTGDIGAAVAIMKGVAGLFAAETTVTGIDLTNALPSRLLAIGVAGRMNGRARMPSAIIRTAVGPRAEPAEWTSKSVGQAFAALVKDAQAAKLARAALPEKPSTPADKAKSDKLEAALARWKAFSDRAGTPDDKGVVPIVAAARLDELAARNDLVARVRVEQASGSIVNTKNLATTLGVDPVKVSGGSIVSYVVTDAGTGEVKAGGIIACRSTLTALRHVQTGRWQRSQSDAKSRCTKLA